MMGFHYKFKLIFLDGLELTQEEIDALINSEDEGEEGEVEEKYSDGFQKEVEEEYPEDPEMNE